MQRQTRSHIQPVELVIVRFRKIAVARFHNHVAGCARAASAARMLDVNSEIDRHVENRLRLPVLVVRHLAVFEFHGLIGIDKRDFGHLLHSIAPPFERSLITQRTGPFGGETAKLPY